MLTQLLLCISQNSSNEKEVRKQSREVKDNLSLFKIKFSFKKLFAFPSSFLILLTFKCFACFGVGLFFSAAEKNAFISSLGLFDNSSNRCSPDRSSFAGNTLDPFKGHQCLSEENTQLLPWENADHHPRVFLVGEISGIRELASWLPVASKPKGGRRKTEFTSSYFLSENTSCNQNWYAETQHVKKYIYGCPTILNVSYLFRA